MINGKRMYHTGFSAFQVPPVRPGDSASRKRKFFAFDLGKIAGSVPRLPFPLDFAVAASYT